MTREEAIKKIKKVIEEVPIFEGELEAFDMAIKALEQELCDDAISRQAVMDCFKKWQPYMATRLFDFEKELSALPSVTPQQRTGRWITSHIPESVLCECSVCGFACGAYSFNYCPNYGAKMEVQE